MWNKFNKHLVVGVIFMLLCNGVTGQAFLYKRPNKQLVAKYYTYKSYIKQKKDVYALAYLPKKYNKQGEIDYTRQIQQAIDRNRRIIMPNFPVLINKSGLKIPSDRVIIFQPNSLILFQGPAVGRLQDIIKIYDARNVEIINAKIKGSKGQPNQTGEWSAGICILNSENVKVSNAYIYDTWGDGIFIGSESSGVSRNIMIENVWVDNARRNAISITSLIDGWINNVLVSNTNGTLPECGIDIEPSVFAEYLQNINFNNFYSYNNNNSAFVINLSALNSDEEQYKPEVTINMNGIYDEKSTRYIELGFNNYDTKYSAKGKVVIRNGMTLTKTHNTSLDVSHMKTNIKLIHNGIKKAD